jgi:hypothetical protein
MRAENPEVIKFIDLIAAKYLILDGDFKTLEALILFYETALDSSQLKVHRPYCKKKIFEINKPFAEGYFKKR